MLAFSSRMMWFFTLILGLVLLLFASPALAQKPAVIVFDNYPPYHYWEDEVPSGLNITIIKEAYALMGVPVRFERMPWKHSLASVKEGTVTGMCAAFRTPEREKFALYPREYLSIDENMVFAQAGSEISVQRIGDLRSLKVGVTQEYSYGAEFDSMAGLEKDAFITDDKLVKMLIEGRVDVAVGNRLVLPYLAKQHQGEGGLKPLYNLGGQPLNLLFSKALGEEAEDLVRRFDHAMKQMRMTGRLEELRNEYSKTIVVSADEWCPFNCEPDSSAPGYAIELLERIFSEHGYSVRYVVKPWDRVVHEARIGFIDAAIGVVQGEAPDFVFPKVEAGIYRVGFYCTDSEWSFEGPESLSGFVFGVASGYSYGKELDALIANGTLLVEERSGTTPLETNIRMALRDRIDGVLADHSVFDYVSKRLKGAESLRYCGSPHGGTPWYVAFSPQREKSELFAKMLSDGIEKLRKSGELETILAKYNLTDWR